MHEKNHAPKTFGIIITIGRLSDDKYISFKIVKKMLGYLGLKQSIIFLTVRLGYFTPVFARAKIAPFAITVMLLTPIIVIMYFRRKVNVDQIRVSITRMDIAELKRERTKGVVFVMLSSCSILIALIILYALTVLNII